MEQTSYLTNKQTNVNEIQLFNLSLHCMLNLHTCSNCYQKRCRDYFKPKRPISEVILQSIFILNQCLTALHLQRVHL